MSVSNSYSLKRSAAAVAAAVSLLAVAAPTQAAIVASFDPVFGQTIPYLAFFGSTTFDVSRGCYAAAAAAGPGYVPTSSSCVVTATSAEINYYNYTDTPTTGVLTTVDLDQSYFASDYVIDVLFDANDQVAGFDTNDSEQFAVFISQSSSNSNNPIYYNGNMLLYFTAPIDADPAFLVDCVHDSDGNPTSGESCSRNDNANSFAAGVTIQNTDSSTSSVPEPGTMPLALIGVGAVAAARRRRHKDSSRKLRLRA